MMMKKRRKRLAALLVSPEVQVAFNLKKVPYRFVEMWTCLQRMTA